MSSQPSALAYDLTPSDQSQEPVVQKQPIQRFNALRMPLILGVVYLHMLGYARSIPDSFGLAIDHETIGDAAAFLISKGIARAAVPAFYFMSGYLLFFTVEAFDKAVYLTKLRSRAKTLLVPYLFWNLLALAIIFGAKLVPSLSGFVVGRYGDLFSIGPLALFASAFGLTAAPIAYQFWFIRDLMALVVLSPLIYGLGKRTGFLLIFGLAAISLLNLWPLYVPSLSATMFFAAGCVVAMKRGDPFALDPFFEPLAAFYAVLLAAAWFLRHSAYADQMEALHSAVGVVIMLCATRYAVDPPPRFAALARANMALAKPSFFVFCMHEPLLTILRKLLVKVVPMGPGAPFFLYYITLPLITIGLCLLAYAALIRAAPRFTKIISGGR